LETFVDRGQLRKLAEPTFTPTGKRIPGLKLDHPRQLALMQALVRFAHIAAGREQNPRYRYDNGLNALTASARCYSAAARLAAFLSRHAISISVDMMSPKVR
jgi:hypothetical protein